jgi:NCS1 family nucleobase:cation symporter-1
MRAAELRTLAAAKATTFVNAFKSREGFKYFIETRDTTLGQHGDPDSRHIWSNEDLDPTPPEKVARVLQSGNALLT